MSLKVILTIVFVAVAVIDVAAIVIIPLLKPHKKVHTEASIAYAEKLDLIRKYAYYVFFALMAVLIIINLF